MLKNSLYEEDGSIIWWDMPEIYTLAEFQRRMSYWNNKTKAWRQCWLKGVERSQDVKDQTRSLYYYGMLILKQTNEVCRPYTIYELKTRG